MADDARRIEGLGVGAFLTGLVAAAITGAQRTDLLKITVLSAIPEGDGWAIECVTDAGFEYTVRVDLTGS